VITSAWKAFGIDVTIVEALQHLVPLEDGTTPSCSSGRSAATASAPNGAPPVEPGDPAQPTRDRGARPTRGHIPAEALDFRPAR
jgi:hypothetical protein